jgi:hypothetical protein
MRFAFPFFLISILFVACEKDPIQYTVEGTITTSLGGPLSGAEVELSQNIFSANTTNNYYSPAGNEVTDANGKYSMTFLREKVVEFEFSVSKLDYFPYTASLNTTQIKTDKINELNVTLDPKAYVQFNITNTWPNDEDEFKLIIQNFREGCNTCATNTTLYLNGAIDTTINYTTTGGVYARFIYINVTGGGSKIDSVFATPFETTVYDIIY